MGIGLTRNIGFETKLGAFFCLFCIGFSNKSSGNEDIDVYFALLGNDSYDYFVLFFYMNIRSRHYHNS